MTLHLIRLRLIKLLRRLLVLTRTWRLDMVLTWMLNLLRLRLNPVMRLLLLLNNNCRKFM